jgi:DNA-binding beta-propeller fold protein YncE
MTLGGWSHAWRLGVVVSAALLPLAAGAQLAADGIAGVQTPTGQFITPAALRGAVQQDLNPGLAAYPHFVAGEAVRAQLSPDGRTLAVLCAGQNSLYKPDGKVDTAHSTQYLFLYDVAGARRAHPRLLQVIPQANAHVGLVFAPDGKALYAAGGKDDAVYVYRRNGRHFDAAGAIALGHGGKGVGVNVQPNASGLAVSADGRTLVVANNYNDSISVIDTATQTVRYEHDLRPFAAGNEGLAGGVGGSYPLAVAIKGNGLAYVSSVRDREVVAVDISGTRAGRLVARIPLDGNGQGLVLDAAQARLYVAQDNADQVAVIDTATQRVLHRIDARAPTGMLPGRKYTGAATFAVTLSRDGKTLYAVNAGANSVAVIPLVGPDAHRVTGLIPTAYEPHDLSFSADGRWMYLVHGKSLTGPNPGRLSGQTAQLAAGTDPQGTGAAAAARAANQYQMQLERASLISAPVPSAAELPVLTAKVAQNNFYSLAPVAGDVAVMGFLRERIRHVIYVVKENRTFDQVLGDLDNGGRAAPRLAQFGRAITPNYHRLATQFVTLDNFMNPGDGSMDGWSWTMQGRVTNSETITQQISYAAVNRGLSYESEGANRNVPVNLPTVAEREAALGPVSPNGGGFAAVTADLPGGTANVLTGTGNHASTDAPFGTQKGFIFSAVLNAGKTVRNYGFLVNNIGRIGSVDSPLADPFAAAEVQVAAVEPELAAHTDLYFRGYDQNYPDLWRYQEWKREFDAYVARGELPALSLVRISHDHMGNFGTALAGVNTPEAQQADCDLALGKLIEAVARSPFARDTLVIVIVIEDDVQDGPDHVDSHRGPVFIVGPYVKQGAVVGTRYSQVNVLRTIEDVLGTEHINLNTAFQRPMADVFDIATSGDWSYTAVASTLLKGTALDLTGVDGGIPFAAGPTVQPRRTAAYWARATRQFDFSEADQVPPDAFNRVLWKGLMGGRPYPRLVNAGGAAKVKAPDLDD